MNRGDRREPIFLDDEDRERFLATLGEGEGTTQRAVSTTPRRWDAGGYFPDWFNKNFCNPSRLSVLIKSTPASSKVCQASRPSGAAQKRSLRPCPWALSTICLNRHSSSPGMGPFPRQ